MEFNSLATAVSHEAGAEVNILSPVDGSPTDFFITIQGADSKAWRRQKKIQATRIIEAKASDSLESLDYDLMDAESLAEVTLGWRGLNKNGKEHKFTKKNAVELYRNAPNLVEQLLKFITKHEVFTNG